MLPLCKVQSAKYKLKDIKFSQLKVVISFLLFLSRHIIISFPRSFAGLFLLVFDVTVNENTLHFPTPYKFLSW